ncbi:response regulator transcription factor [Actinomadura rayongensis]|uniref:Response regulator n=1 Tax=Actinomadura rayongensis TaxID=1429076 RepID=A0A6I4W532_9ACTN|nr:response regulator transcription factor [Actinomadura rayongensis]MXQ64578.1 response regulator [Actinomadura rayongensis]
MTIRVVVVDGHTLCRLGLAHVVRAHPDIELAGEAGSLAEGRLWLESGDPTVVVIARRLPDGDGLTLASALRTVRPDIGIVVMAPRDGDEALFRAMDLRASAFVDEAAPVAELLAAIRHAAVAPLSFTASDLVGALRRRRGGDLLSAREREVLSLLTNGLSIAEIARTMHLSHSTAKTYTARLYEKLGAANRAQALMAALRQGLIRPEEMHATDHPKAAMTAP